MPDLTLEDIAKEAGVSRSTVSRVVNGHPNVSEKVRKRVLKVIQNKDFHPNHAARSLASQRTSMIGLVLPHSVSAFFTDPYFPHLTQGIAYGCNNHDLTLALFLIGNREDEEKIYPRISRRGLLDGILIQSGAIGDQLIERISRSNMPEPDHRATGGYAGGQLYRRGQRRRCFYGYKSPDKAGLQEYWHDQRPRYRHSQH